MEKIICRREMVESGIANKIITSLKEDGEILGAGEWDCDYWLERSDLIGDCWMIVVKYPFGHRREIVIIGFDCATLWGLSETDMQILEMMTIRRVA
ncbi:MAG: hypothetical protein WCX69_05445 [Candidatus Paceibacterota bacterium]